MHDSARTDASVLFQKRQSNSDELIQLGGTEPVQVLHILSTKQTFSEQPTSHLPYSIKTDRKELLIWGTVCESECRSRLCGRHADRAKGSKLTAALTKWRW